MKKADFIINIALVPIDFILIILAAISAYALRFSESVSQIRPVFYTMPSGSFFALAAKVALVSIVVFALSGFYTMRSKKLASEFTKIVTGVSTVVIILILAIFWQRELFSSRFIIISSWLLAILYLFSARIILAIVRNYYFKKGFGLARVLVLGSSAERHIIVDAYRQRPQLGFKVIGEISSLSALESAPDLMDKIKQRKIDGIIQADSSLAKDEALDLLTFCQEQHISLQYVANLFQTQSLHLNLSSVAGLPMVEIQGTPLDGWRRVYKRIFDTIIAFILLLVLSPLFIILAIIIKTDSSGPVFVKLQRVGSRGRLFGMYKFRSMVKDAHKMKAEIMSLNERTDGPLFKMSHDPRVTKFGHFLRRSSLDELPQLFNVLVGQMSLVGPRPHEPEEVGQYQRGYKKLLTIKPGMTGLAQVSGRANLPFAEEAKLDIFYIENWSILLDLIILLKTPKAMIKGD